MAPSSVQTPAKILRGSCAGAHVRCGTPGSSSPARLFPTPLRCPGGSGFCAFKQSLGRCRNAACILKDRKAVPAATAGIPDLPQSAASACVNGRGSASRLRREKSFGPCGKHTRSCGGTEPSWQPSRTTSCQIPLPSSHREGDIRHGGEVLDSEIRGK